MELYRVYFKNEQKYGKNKRESVVYCTETKERAERIFKSEADKGDVITSIRKDKEQNNKKANKSTK